MSIKRINNNNTSFLLDKGYISFLFLNRINYRFFSSKLPLIIYNDSLLNKSDVLKDNIGKSGIYRWVNNINNKSYVGSSVNLYRRFTNYYSKTYLNRSLSIGNSRIYKALLLYGYETFNLEILEYCDKEFVIDREQYYIDLLKPEYNIQSIAGIVLSPPGYTTTVVNKKDNSVKVYDSMRAAARGIGINYSTLINYANKDKLLKGIYLITSVNHEAG